MKERFPARTICRWNCDLCNKNITGPVEVRMIKQFQAIPHDCGGTAEMITTPEW